MIKEIEKDVFTCFVEEHSTKKDIILGHINEIPNNPMMEEGQQKIIHTDWNMPKQMERKYITPFVEIIDPSLRHLAIRYNCKTCILANIWFQQYEANSGFHTWHVHEHAHFACVYLLEGSKEHATEIQISNKIFKPSLQEGDLLIFPAYYLHRSAPFESGRKTVIAFNLNLRGS